LAATFVRERLMRRVDSDFTALANCITDGIALIDDDCYVDAWSEGAEAITGIPAMRAQGAALRALFARMQPDLSYNAHPQAVELVANDERRAVIHATALRVTGGWLLSFGREARFAEIEQLKDEILAAVSHELRTPIATIKAFATTMRANPDALANDRDDFLATIEESADRLARLVDDLLLVGRIGARHLLSRRVPVTVDALLDSAESRLPPTSMPRIERRSTNVLLDGDPDLLADALMQLLDNALKFSAPAAPVTIEARSEQQYVAVAVRDRGIGITQEHLPYIFERFYRVERNLAAIAGGNGLGLAIAREIVQAHGGTLRVESVPQQGSVFTMELPARGIL
jgi:two-component system, OmpR family, phosphate regulon sensor histidine kinase PhoR